MRRKAADDNPSVGRYQVDLALSLSNLGVTYARKGDRQKSLAAHEQARDILGRLCAAGPRLGLGSQAPGGRVVQLAADHGEVGRWAEEAKALGRPGRCNRS